MSEVNGGKRSRIAVLGSGTMGAQIALSFALHDTAVSLWGRRKESLTAAVKRIETDLDYMIEVGLATTDTRSDTLGRVTTTRDLTEATTDTLFVIEAVVEDLPTKQRLLSRVEPLVASDVVLSSTTSAISATDLQTVLTHPARFAVAHYAQPGHLVRLVEVVPGARTAEATTRFVIDLLTHIGKRPVPCPDIPGFLWSRIQHAVLRECVNLIDRGLATPEVCDAVIKEGYAVRLPAMGCFEHADLAGLDLIDSDASRAVWADLSTASSPADTAIGKFVTRGDLGMRTGRGFYDWTKRDPDDFKRNRDAEIVRRMLIQAGGTVQPP